MDVTIRAARPGDIPGMSDLLTGLFSIEADFSPDVEKQVRGLSVLVGAPPGRSCVLVAERGGAVIGMATVQTLISTAEGGRVGMVEDVIVDPEFRSRGIGTRLLNGIAAWSERTGLKRLQLLADRDNIPALDFYASRNWSSTRLICLRRRC
jgi:GNAT superfamily N-acetyltransferase